MTVKQFGEKFNDSYDPTTADNLDLKYIFKGRSINQK